MGGCISGSQLFAVCLVGPETQGPRSDRASASVPLHPCNHPMTGGDGRSANAWWWTAARDTRVTRSWSVPPDWWRPCSELRPHFSLIELQPQSSLPAGGGHEKIDSLPTAGSMIFIHLHALPSRRRLCPPNPPTLQRRLAEIPPLFSFRPAVPRAWCLMLSTACLQTQAAGRHYQTSHACL